MREYKVGETITLEVQEGKGCKGCFFNDAKAQTCYREDSIVCSCYADERSDGKNIVFVEKGK